MNSVGRTIRSYVLWTHDRGSVHYDVMVTLILCFIFIAPRFLNFNDKPVERTPHQTGVLVSSDGGTGFIYQVEASAVTGSDDDAIRDSLRQVIEPIAGEVEIRRFEPVRNGQGHVTGYKAWVSR